MDKEIEIHVVIPTYNDGDKIRRAVDSALQQEYSNFSVYLYDDGSTDNTREIIESIKDDRLHYRYQENVGTPLYYYQKHAQAVDKDIVIAHVDGDDMLYHSKVLSRVNSVYTDDVWLTYGQFIDDKGVVGFCGEIKDTGSYRHERLLKASHLRTYRAGLFALIKDKDLRWDNGRYYRRATDLTFLYPMIEMAGKQHIRFIDEILYYYDTSAQVVRNKSVAENNEEVRDIKRKSGYLQINSY